jgi:hypothetical protein
MNAPAIVAMIGDRVVEDDRYKFRADLPGNVSERVEDFGVRGAALTWRLYTSSSPESQTNGSYNAAVKIFDTDTTDVRQLFTAGENDAVQSLGIPLLARKDGTFGAEKLPSMTLSFQSGMDGAAGVLKGRVLLVVKGSRLYEVSFSYRGSDQGAVETKFFESFEILK